MDYEKKLYKAASAGLDRLNEFLEGRKAMSDDDKLRAKYGLGAASAAVRLESARTNRMAVELMREKWDAQQSLPAGRKVA